MFRIRTRERVDSALLYLKGYQGQRKGAGVFHVASKLTSGIHGEKSQRDNFQQKESLMKLCTEAAGHLSVRLMVRGQVHRCVVCVCSGDTGTDNQLGIP